MGLSRRLARTRGSFVPVARHHQVTDTHRLELPVQAVAERARLVATPHRLGLLLLPLHPVRQPRRAEFLCRLRYFPVHLPHHRDRVRVDIQSKHDYFSQYLLQLAFGVGFSCRSFHRSRCSLSGTLTTTVASTCLSSLRLESLLSQSCNREWRNPLPRCERGAVFITQRDGDLFRWLFPPQLRLDTPTAWSKSSAKGFPRTAHFPAGRGSCFAP